MRQEIRCEQKVETPSYTDKMSVESENTIREEPLVVFLINPLHYAQV